MSKSFGFVTCHSNEALIVSGCCHRRPTILLNGWVFVWPGIHLVQRLSLSTMTLTVESTRVHTQYGVPISLIGTAKVNIPKQNKDMLRTACELFLSKSKEEIMQIATTILECRQHDLIASMSEEKIFKNDKMFAEKVFEMASNDLLHMGLMLISYCVNVISDEHDCFNVLKEAEAAELKCKTRIIVAQAQRDALIKEALDNEEKESVESANNTKIAKLQHDLELKRTNYDAQMLTQKASFELAAALQNVHFRKKIMQEKMESKIRQKELEISIQDQEICRREKELEATVKKPAEAERYRMEKLAEANKEKILIEAEAQAAAIRLRAEAEAAVVLAKTKVESEILTELADVYKMIKNSIILKALLRQQKVLRAKVTTRHCRWITGQCVNVSELELLSTHLSAIYEAIVELEDSTEENVEAEHRYIESMNKLNQMIRYPSGPNGLSVDSLCSFSHSHSSPWLPL